MFNTYILEGSVEKEKFSKIESILTVGTITKQWKVKLNINKKENKRTKDLHGRSHDGSPTMKKTTQVSLQNLSYLIINILNAHTNQSIQDLLTTKSGKK